MTVAEFQARSQVSLKLIDAIGGKPIFWMFIFPLGVFFWKCVFWDTVLGSMIENLPFPVTPPLKGDISTWSGWIIGGIFCHSLGMNIANRIIK